MFDVYVLPLNLEKDGSAPVVLAAQPPKRVDRARMNDNLLICAFPVRSVQTVGLQSLLENAAMTYYESRAGVTSGLKMAAETILAGKTLRSGTLPPVLCGLMMLVSRGDTLTVSQLGAGMLALFGKGRTLDLSNPATSTHVSRLSSTSGMNYRQEQVQAGDLLALCAPSEIAWNPEGLIAGTRLTLEQTRRRLAATYGEEFPAVLVQFQSGKGEVHRMRSAPSADEQAQVVPPRMGTSPLKTFPAREVPLPAQAIGGRGEGPGRDGTTLPTQPDGQNPVQAVSPADRMRERLAGRGRTSLSGFNPEVKNAAPASQTNPIGEAIRSTLKKIHLPKIDQSRLRKTLVKIWEGGHKAQDKAAEGIKGLADRISPGLNDPAAKASPATLLTIAVAVPALVVFLALVIYLNSGRNQQHTAYLEKAQQFASQAETQSDPALKRSDWKQALQLALKAEEYGTSDESQELMRKAQIAVDDLDGIVRPVFQALTSGGLEKLVKITQITASDSELFMLDANQGRALRMFWVGTGYELDPQFKCEPGGYNGVAVGNLVDIVVLPYGNAEGADLLGIDEMGNLLYCTIGGEPLGKALPVPPTGWGQITAMSLSAKLLFVMDTIQNEVWIYYGDGFVYEETPETFYKMKPGSEEYSQALSETPDPNAPVTADEKKAPPPPNLNDAIDLVVNNGEDLYILHQSGMMTLCTVTTFEDVQTRCTSPMAYGDPRPGNEPKPLAFPSTNFRQIALNQGPDPSLYVLDSQGPAIYHLSLQLLNLHRQLLPQLNSMAPEVRQPLVAIAVSPNQMIFIANQSQIYYAQVP